MIFPLAVAGAGLAITGSIFCGFENAHAANCTWALGNLALILHTIQTKQPELFVMYCVFEFWALFGIAKHYRTTHPREQGATA